MDSEEQLEHREKRADFINAIKKIGDRTDRNGPLWTPFTDQTIGSSPTDDQEAGN
jgi:hypothetical protein